MARIIPIFLVFVLAVACSPQEEKEAPKSKVVRMKVPDQRPGRGETKQESQLRNQSVSPMEMVRAPSKPTPRSTVEPPKEVQPDPLSEGYCRVRKGDSLYAIAGREEVYGDPLQWLSLLRLNRDSLDLQRNGAKIMRRELPEGLKLRFITPTEAAQNRSRFGQKSWVVNVISLETPEQLVPHALSLMKEGYPVYMTKATVKGKQWFRLRVGFFQDRASAVAARGEIMTQLGIEGSWVDDAPEELKARGGYVG
jgi:hypothetical protein